MFRRVNFYSICFAFCLSVLLIIAGSRYTDNSLYRPSSDNRRNVRNFLKIDDGDDSYYQSIPANFDDVLNVDKILNKTRVRIKSNMFFYNYTLSGVNQLEDLVLESNGKPLRSLIVSTWRSGTTFLGEILNSLPGNFYHYEPLLSYDIKQIRGSPHADDALYTMKKMMNCDFDGLDGYFEFGKKYSYQFTHNTRLWDHCKYKKELCYSSEFTSKFCKLFPFQSMKVVRIRLRLLQKLLQDDNLNLKLILLIRDPRAVMQSRQHRDFCQPSPDCWRPELVCADMISDYVAAGRLLQKYPGKLFVLRYEELAINPFNVTYELFNFLGLDVTTSVELFLHSHTNAETTGVSSTFRVSKNVPYKWKSLLDFSYVDEIQTYCKEAMDLWGYRMAMNATHMASKDFLPLDTYSIS